jgi:putative hydrolase of the HAD superfamily
MAEPRQIERTLLIDADDTLWENNIFYLRCGDRFREYLAALGVAPEVAQAMLDRCEREVIPTYGYGPQGFITALGLACERLLQQRGEGVDPQHVAQARSFGEPILAAPMLVLPDVEETLRALLPSSLLVLVTKGDETVQRDKIARSGLGPLFDERLIVAEKDAATYRAIAAQLGLRPRETWMVGNSPKSDINPVIEAGLGAIYIPHDRTWTAEIQQIIHPELVITLRRFADLLGYFGIETEN